MSYLRNALTAAIAALAVSSPLANASTITDQFVFTNDLGTVVASGSFSYDSSSSGTLSYEDLSSFSISLLSRTYDLAFVNSIAYNSYNYKYFGYDTNLNTFVPADVGTPGHWGPVRGFLAATNLTKGFFFDPLASQGGANADGIFARYDPSYLQDTATSLSVTATSLSVAPSVPEPETYAMLLAGLGLMGFVARRRMQY